MRQESEEPPYRKRARENTKEKDQNAERERRHRENREAIDELVREIGTIKEQAEGHQNDHNRKWRCERFWQAGEIAALVLAAIAGFVAIYVGNVDAEKSRQAMNDQLTEMKTAGEKTAQTIVVLKSQAEALKTARRAWIAPGFPEIPDDLIKGKVGTIEIRVPFENVGNEPALSLNEQSRVTPFKWADFQNPSSMEQYWHAAFEGARSCRDLPLNEAGRAIYPKTSRATLVGMAQAHAAQVIEQVGFVGALVMGCFVYQTIGEIHFASLCAVLEPLQPIGKLPQKYRAISCRNHNEAD